MNFMYTPYSMNIPDFEPGIEYRCVTYVLRCIQHESKVKTSTYIQAAKEKAGAESKEGLTILEHAKFLHSFYTACLSEDSIYKMLHNKHRYCKTRRRYFRRMLDPLQACINALEAIETCYNVLKGLEVK